MKPDSAKSDATQPRARRSSLSLCHEAAHFVSEELKRRKRLGLPHQKKKDIIDDWIVEVGKRLGHKEYSGE
jgi:hypothetical protein